MDSNASLMADWDTLMAMPEPRTGAAAEELMDRLRLDKVGAKIEF